VGQDQTEANRWFTQASQLGYDRASQELKEINDPEHDWKLGFTYGKGSFQPKDYAKAIYWYQKAASEGNLISFGELGEMYEKGMGVPVDMDKAFDWYTRGAAKGDWKSKKALKRLENK